MLLWTECMEYLDMMHPKQYNSFELVAAHLILTNFPPQPGQIRISYHTIWRIPTGPGNPSPQDECGCWSEAANADRNWWIVPSLDMNNLSVTIPNSDLEIVYEPWSGPQIMIRVRQLPRAVTPTTTKVSVRVIQVDTKGTVRLQNEPL